MSIITKTEREPVIVETERGAFLDVNGNIMVDTRVVARDLGIPQGLFESTLCDNTFNMTQEFKNQHYQAVEVKRGCEAERYIISTFDGLMVMLYHMQITKFMKKRCVIFTETVRDIQRDAYQLSQFKTLSPCLLDDFRIAVEGYCIARKVDSVNRVPARLIKIMFGETESAFRKKRGLKANERIFPSLSAREEELLKKLQQMDVAFAIAGVQEGVANKALADYVKGVKSAA